MRYKKETSRITVQFIDDSNDKVIAEIKDRNHMSIGDIFTDIYANSIIEHEVAGKNHPKKIMVVAVAYFNLVE